MSKETDFVNGVTVVDESFLDAVQEVMTGLAHNFILEKQSSTAVRVVAGSVNSQTSIIIMGQMRYTTVTKSLTITGGANTYNIYATADTMDRDFALEQSSGASAATYYRKIGEVIWDGSAITEVRNLAGPAVTHNPTLTGTVTIPSPASGSDTTVAATTEWVRDRIADVAPAAHAASHETGGSDEIDLASINGQLVSGQIPSGLITSTMISDGTITDTDVASANKDGSSATASMRTLGTGAAQACAGNDSRLSDSRTPSGAASGDLAGSYPSPTIKSNVDLSGVPTAPTASQGTNTTQIATTAFVQTEAGLLIPKSLVDAKGDIIVATADNTVSKLTSGTNGKSLVVDPTETTGLKWHFPIMPSCRVYRNTGVSQSNNGGFQKITWTSELWDSNAFFSGPSSLLVAPFDGRYRIDAAISFSANTTGKRYAAIGKNQSGTLATVLSRSDAATIVSGDNSTIHVGVTIQLSAGDEIEIFGYQNITGGGNLAYVTGNPDTTDSAIWASMTMISAV